MQLVKPSVFGLMLLDVFADHILIPTYRGYKVPSGPEIVAGEVFLFAEEAPCNVDDTFALDKTNHLRHAVFRRDADQHAHMVHHKMAFDYPTLPLHGKLSENVTQMFSELLIESLLSVLGNPYYMVPLCANMTDTRPL